MTSECKYSTSFFHSQIKKKPYIPHKGPKGFGGTTLINTVPKCLHTVRSSSDNAGKTPYFNCTGLRGRFHDLCTRPFHHTRTVPTLRRGLSLGLLLMYYSLQRRFSIAFVYFMRNKKGCQAPFDNPPGFICSILYKRSKMTDTASETKSSFPVISTQFPGA